MKIASFMAVSVLACVGAATTANAGIFPDTGDKAIAAQGELDRIDTPTPAPQLPTHTQLKLMQKQRDQQARDKDWLVRGYENQLRLDSTGQGQNENGGNFYYQIRTDKNLANLAGLNAMDPLDDDPKTSLKTSTSSSSRSEASLRNDSSAENTTTSQASPSSDIFKPLITPLGSSSYASQHNFLTSDAVESSLPSSYLGSSDIGASQPPAAIASPSIDPNRDPANIDTPGMTAAQKNPLLDQDPPDLMLDALPKESNRATKVNLNDILPPTPQLTSNLDRANTQQQTALKVPGMQDKKTTPPPTVAANPLLLTSPNDPVPDKIAPPSPVRAPIASPYDIFYR